MKKLVIALLLCGVGFAAHAADYTSDELAKAAQLAAAKEAFDGAMSGVDSAKQITINVRTDDGARSPRQRPKAIVIQPGDPEWASVVAAVKSAGARLQGQVQSQLNGIGGGIKVKAAPPEAPPAPPPGPGKKPKP